MTYEIISERTILGFGDVFVYINDISNGLFINVYLTVIFLAILIGLLITQTKQTGDADFSLSLATASIVTAIMTIMFSLVDGLVSPTTNVIVIAITLMSVLFFLFSRK